MKKKVVWTIGHSTRSMEQFMDLLRMHDIQLLVDIRAFPGSRRYPHFSKENLSVSLPANGIMYKHMVGLGGRRRPTEGSANTVWRNASFRGYADYMETEAFREEIAALETLAEENRTVYMCSEAPWWRCHRAMVSDFLKVRGWEVLHIMEKGKTTLHPFTGPARSVQGSLSYDDKSTPG